MNSSDKPEFLRIVTGLAAIKPGKPLTPEGLDLYWLAMQAWPLDEFRTAAAHLASSVEYMPNPYHFEQLRKTAIEQTSGDAWALVLQAVRTMRPRESVTVDSKIDHVVRQMGGYQHLGCMTTEEMPWRMKRFTELWAEQGEVEQAQLALPSAGKKLAGPQRVNLTLARDIRERA